MYFHPLERMKNEKKHYQTKNVRRKICMSMLMVLQK